MPDIPPGPCHLEETLNAIKLQGPTYRMADVTSAAAAKDIAKKALGE
jgi:hypothetical protein